MRSLRERVLHTLLFELIAIAIATPVIGVVTGASMADSGMLSVLISVGRKHSVIGPSRQAA